MPNMHTGHPLPGEEVLLPDGNTNIIKCYIRSRFLSDDDTTVGHVCQMARPFRFEYVTVVAYDEINGNWISERPRAHNVPDASIRASRSLHVPMFGLAALLAGFLLGIICTALWLS